MRIEMLGAHNTETDRVRLPCLLVDDVIALDAGGLTASLPLERQRQIKAVLLTHHHFDHCKDLIMLGANSLPSSTVDIYGLRDTLETVYLYLLDGKLYRDYTCWPSAENPRMKLKPVSPFQPFLLQNLEVLPLPVSHSVPSAGYFIKAEGGKSFFYTGDTGPGLEGCWERIAPDLLVIEVTHLNRAQKDMERLRHMTPGMLAQELMEFRKARDYLPRVIVGHLPVAYEDEMREEIAAVGKQIEMEIEVGYEGLTIEL
ncbi:MAG: MBL fold metallo-hydrolase [Dehalococcoidia bacterium]|nr:MBL fold metallo-hydrolase [Dehalococcoidia bacterium]